MQLEHYIEPYHQNKSHCYSNRKITMNTQNNPKRKLIQKKKKFRTKLQMMKL